MLGRRVEESGRGFEIHSGVGCWQSCIVPAVVKKLGYKGITQSILVARTSVMSQNGSKCYFRSFPMLG